MAEHTPEPLRWTETARQRDALLAACKGLVQTMADWCEGSALAEGSYEAARAAITQAEQGGYQKVSRKPLTSARGGIRMAVMENRVDQSMGTEAGKMADRIRRVGTVGDCGTVHVLREVDGVGVLRTLCGGGGVERATEYAGVDLADVDCARCRKLAEAGVTEVRMLTRGVSVDIGRTVVVRDINSNRMIHGRVRSAYIAGEHGDDINSHLWADVETGVGRIFRVSAQAVLASTQAHCYCTALRRGRCDYCAGLRPAPALEVCYNCGSDIAPVPEDEGTDGHCEDCSDEIDARG